MQPHDQAPVHPQQEFVQEGAPGDGGMAEDDPQADETAFLDERELDVVLRQAHGGDQAAQGVPKGRGAEHRAQHQRETAASQRPAQEAEELVVEPVHQQTEERHVLIRRDAEPADDTVEAIRRAGGRAVTCAGSVVAPDFAERFVGTALKTYGGLDIVVNNAGYTWDSVVQKMTDEQWYAMIDVHLTAPFRILRAAQPVIRQLVKADEAAGRRAIRKVINISSVAGLFGNAGQINYAAGKAGIVGMTQSLAKEWGRLNTTVNCVAFKVGVNPELLATMERTIPLGRGGTPEEAAGAVFLFAIPESDYVRGQTLMCTGGLTGI